MKPQKEFNLGYRIIKIQTTKFEFREIETDDINLIFEQNGFLRIDSGVRIDIDKERETIIFDIESSVIENATELKLISHTGKTTFQVKGLEEVYDTESNSFDFPNEFMIQLYSLSYSHARALLATELSGTMYRDKFFLPVINPSTIIND